MNAKFFSKPDPFEPTPSGVGVVDPYAALSPVERRVFDLALAGVPNKLIAQRLSVSVRTVERHRAAALRRLRVETLVEAAGLRATVPAVSLSTFDVAFSTTVPAGLVDADGRFVAVNAEYCRTLGFSEEDLLATPYPSVTYPADLPVLLPSIRRLFTGESDSERVEKRTLTATGIIQVTLALSTVWGGDGVPRFVLGQVLKSQSAAA